MSVETQYRVLIVFSCVGLAFSLLGLFISLTT